VFGGVTLSTVLLSPKKENFKMRKENFIKLCDELRPFIERDLETCSYTY